MKKNKWMILCKNVQNYWKGQNSDTKKPTSAKVEKWFTEKNYIFKNKIQLKEIIKYIQTDY